MPQIVFRYLLTSALGDATITGRGLRPRPAYDGAAWSHARHLIYYVGMRYRSVVICKDVRMIISLPTKSISVITVKNIYQSFIHNMATKASWH